MVFFKVTQLLKVEVECFYFLFPLNSTRIFILLVISAEKEEICALLCEMTTESLVMRLGVNALGLGCCTNVFLRIDREMIIPA